MGEAPPIDLMQGTKNYSSFYDLIEAAEEELERHVKKGFAVTKDAGWISERFGSGTISNMALIQKTKDDGCVKNHVVVDLLRSGGDARASALRGWSFLKSWLGSRFRRICEGIQERGLATKAGTGHVRVRDDRRGFTGRLLSFPRDEGGGQQLHMPGRAPK